tara:strand:- start:4019 stop:5293 length:1275 start_codon:yes stop_codon:yes gene_type:complete
MAKQTIGIGSSANDGTGDPLRTAFDKINDNFTELYGSTAEANDLVEDTSPQLGGDMDVNGQRITSARSNEDIILLPNGTGGVVASAVRIAGTTLSSDDSSSITIAEGLQANGVVNIDGAVTATSTVAVTGATTLSSTLAVTGATTITDALTATSVTTNEIVSNGSNADITLDPTGTGDINLTAGADVNLPANIGLTFGDDAEKIEGDGTDLTISGNNINLTAVADIVVPANVGITFGTGEKIEGDNTNLTITSGGLCTITATGQTVVTNAFAAGSINPGVTTLAATASITEASHSGRTLNMAEVGGNALATFTLPAATGSGAVYKFVVGVVNTSNYVIKVADATDTIDGMVIVQNDSTAGGTASLIAWPTVAASDTITLDGTTTGGAQIGDYILLTDMIANQYVVSGMLNASGTEATPFSATVS